MRRRLEALPENRAVFEVLAIVEAELTALGRLAGGLEQGVR
jgi:hypothetical protein